MKTPRLSVILFLLFLVNFVYRLSLISQGPYYADCLLLAVKSEDTLQTFRINYLEGTGLPLTTVAGAFFVGLGKLLGMTDIVTAVNLMSVTLSSLCVPVFYLFLRVLFGDRAALVGAIVLSFQTIFLGLSTFGNSQMLSTLLFLLTLWTVVRYLHSSNPRTLYAAAVWFGFLGAARLQDMVATAPALAVLFWVCPGMQGKKISFKNLTIFAFITVSVATVFYVPSLMNRSHFTAAEFLPHYMAMVAQTLDRVDGTTVRIVLKWMFMSISLLGCLASVVGFWLMYKEDRAWFAAAAALVFLPMLTFAVFWYSLPRMYLIPAVMLIIPLSYAFAALDKTHPKLFKGAVLCLLLSLVINHIGIYQTVKFRHDHALLPDFYRWIGTVTETDARIIERDHSLFITYYSRRVPLGVPVTLFEADQNNLQAYKEQIDALLAQKIPVYITDTGLNGFPEHLKFDEFMHAHFEFEPIGDQMIEDWYNDILVHSVVKNSLYRVKKD